MTVTDPKLMIRWRDNNRANWSNEHYISLGNIGETDLILRLKRLGVFRTRQFELVVTDVVAASFGDAEVDITVLR